MKTKLLLPLTALLLAALPVRADYAGNNALAFTGSQSVVTLNVGNIIPTNEVTVEFWAYSTAVAQQSAFMLGPDQGANRFQAHINYNNGYTYWDFGNITTSGRVFAPNPAGTLNNWTHYALVASASGNFMRIYTNGVPFVSKTGMTPFVRGDYELRIGGNSGFTYNGRLDEFRVWNRARSQAEIQATKDFALAGSETNLVLYYRFDGTNTIVATNYATISGAAFNSLTFSGIGWVAGAPIYAAAPEAEILGYAPWADGAILHGKVRPGVSAADCYFQYGPTLNYGSVSAVTSVPAGTNRVEVIQKITGLAPFTLYYYAFVASNSAGTSVAGDAGWFFTTGDPTNLVLNANDAGAGSLRAAIGGVLPGSIIQFAPALSGQTITLTSGQLALANDLTIDASSLPGGLTLSGNNSSRIFYIGNNATVNLNSLTLTSGNAGTGPGGAIYSFSGCILTVSHCTIVSNSATGNTGAGGGICNAGTLTLNQSTLSGNSATGSVGSTGGTGAGGGIYNSGTLTLNQSTLSGNSAIGRVDSTGGSGAGGGIYNNYGTLTLNQGTLSGNSAYGRTGAGGGIYNNYGTLTLNQSTLSGNSATGGNGQSVIIGTGGPGGSGQGGGIYNAGTLTLGGGTLSGNSATGGTGGTGGYPGNGGPGGPGEGGGIYNVGTLTLGQSTLSGNSATGGAGGAGGAGSFGGNGGLGTGGAIYSGISLVTKQITVANNAARGGLGGLGGADGIGTGGGLAGTNAISLFNDLIALNLADAAPDVSGSVTSQGHNFLGSTNGSTGVTNGVNGDLAGTVAAPLNPLLGPLTNNGGLTFTLALLPGSPAIDAGDDSATNTFATDQRGYPRRSGAHVDIGAVELQTATQPSMLTGLTRLGNGSFQFSFTNLMGASFTVFASTNAAWPLNAWSNLGAAHETPPGSGQYHFTDPQATNYLRRFYRVRSP
jgi:hypothetical protein